MPSPSSAYTSYEGSYYNGKVKPPPPPPKPEVQEAGSTYSTTENQSTSSPSIRELPYDNGVVTHVTAQATDHAQLQGVIYPPHNHDPGQEWLPKILEGKSKQNLVEILENPKLLNALAYSASTAHPSISAYQSFFQDTLKENIALTLHLKEVEAHLTQLRSTCQAQLLSTHALERQWRQKQSEMDQALAPFAPPSLYQNLSQAIQEQEQICSSLETNFLENDGVATERETTEWVRKFRQSRKLYYSRLSRKERWDEGRIGGWR